MSKGTLTVKVLGNTSDFDSKMGGLSGVAGKAFAAVGLAAAAGAVKSVMAFTEFEGQMNEVFTLLPGITQDAMDGMTSEVKNFSKEFGVLPDKVVPALYQALSAGVPKDNVFEFLETAQMAAKGGVTDLTTAVDGISSVVNAYGSDIVSATQASDLMFTAVRLGKTNFEELSSSLSNVTPIASGLGVSFEDVSAGLAAMTAKGTPTAQATTQLRSLFVELSKAGGKTAKTFEDMAGKSFQQFIAEGGNTSEALWLMQKAADESGVELQDLFGSVEAGAAALSLASGSTFADNIDEMGSAAGATEKAFDQMMTGLGPIFDKMKANAAVFLIDIGQKLAPLVEVALDRVSAAFANVKKVVQQVVDILFKGDFTGGPFAEDSAIVDTLFNIREALVRVAGMARQTFDILFKGDFTGGPFAEDSAFIDALFNAREVMKRIVDFVRENMTVVLSGLGAAVATIVVPAFVAWAAASLAAAAATIAAAAPAIALVAAVGLLTGAVVYAYQHFDIFRSTVDAVAAFLVDVVWPKIQEFADFIVAKFTELVAWTQSQWGAIQEAISHIINVIAGIIRTTIDVISALWRAWGDDLGRMVATAWAFIRSSIENAINLVRNVIQTVLAIINGDWGAAWDGIKGIAAAVWDQIKNVISTAINLVKSIIGGVLSTIGQVWAGAWEYIRDFMGGVWDQIQSAVTTALEGVLGFFRDLPGEITGAVGDLGDVLKGAGRALMDGLLAGIKAGFESVKNFAGGIAGKVASLKGPLEYDRKVLITNGLALMEGLDRGLRLGLRPVLGTAASVAPAIASAVAGSASVNLSNSNPTSATADEPGSGVGYVRIHPDDLRLMGRMVQTMTRQSAA